jgi:hypothetical protein
MPSLHTPAPIMDPPTRHGDAQAAHLRVPAHPSFVLFGCALPSRLREHGFAAGSQNRCVAGRVDDAWEPCHTQPEHHSPAKQEPDAKPSHTGPHNGPPTRHGDAQAPDKGGSGVWSGRPNDSGIHRWRRPAGAPQADTTGQARTGHTTPRSRFCHRSLCVPGDPTGVHYGG